MRRLAWAVGFARGALALVEAVATVAGRIVPWRRLDEPLPFAAGEARAVAVGAFQTLDAVHRSRGTATVWRLADGGSLLRLQDFQVTLGPDLWLVLSEDERPSSGTRLRSGAHLDVARLRGIRGSQNYPLPAEIDPSQFRSLAVYCRAFNILFSLAPLDASLR